METADIRLGGRSVADKFPQYKCGGAIMKKSLLSIVLVLIIAAAIVGCKQTPKELKIAIIAPSPTGELSHWGASILNGVQMAIEEWNAKGGILGRKIVPITEDSRGDAAAAAEAARKVIGTDHVHFIIGDAFSNTSIAISEVANAAKVIQISPSSTSAGLTVDKNGATKAYVFRACFTDPFQAAAAAEFAAGKLKARKAFVLSNPDDGYSDGLAGAFKPAFIKAGGSIVGEEHYSGTDTDFSGILRKAKAAKPDVVYLPDMYWIANHVLAQSQLEGMEATFLGPDGWLAASFEMSIFDGSYMTEHYWGADPRPEVQTFNAAYTAKFEGTPGFVEVGLLAGLSYDAANLLFQCIQKAGGDDIEKVKVALEGSSFSGVSGTFTIDTHHDPVKALTILHITGDKIEYESTVSP
jgi:branched-chain amino acid transport system substrate-binding protein